VGLYDFDASRGAFASSSTFAGLK